MPKKIEIEIVETLDFLEKSLAKTTGLLQQDRMRTLINIKNGTCVFYTELAKKLNRTPKTIRTWIQIYYENGLSGMLEVKSGGNNTKKLSKEMVSSIAQKLTNPKSTITSYVELLALLKEEFKEAKNLKYMTLYIHCRHKHQAKLKVARKSHYKKDENAEAFFKKPRIKARRA